MVMPEPILLPFSGDKIENRVFLHIQLLTKQAFPDESLDESINWSLQACYIQR